MFTGCVALIVGALLVLLNLVINQTTGETGTGANDSAETGIAGDGTDHGTAGRTNGGA